jgi:hypothetical protein
MSLKMLKMELLVMKVEKAQPEQYVSLANFSLLLSTASLYKAYISE